MKKKGMLVCADCGTEFTKNDAEDAAEGPETGAPDSEDMMEGSENPKCPNCGSEKIKKTLVIIRKEIADVDEELEDDDDDEDDDEDEEDDEGLEIEDEDDEEGDDEEEEVLENEPPVIKSLNRANKKTAFVEAMNLSTALAESVAKILTGKISKAQDTYEEVMTDFNAVMDTAFKSWVSGETVSKSNNLDEQAILIHKRVNNIIKEGGAAMPNKKTRPESLDSLELPDDVKAYIASLETEEGDVEKADIFKGLSPEVAAIVKRAEITNEQAEAQKFIDVAKAFTHIPGDKVELAKSLRHSSETDEEGYKTLISTLTATNENLKDSSVFKSFGKPGSGDKVSKKSTEAAELVSKGVFKTLEAAEVSLMNGSDYIATTHEAN